MSSTCLICLSWSGKPIDRLPRYSPRQLSINCHVQYLGKTSIYANAFFVYRFNRPWSLSPPTNWFGWSIPVRIESNCFAVYRVWSKRIYSTTTAISPGFCWLCSNITEPATRKWLNICSSYGKRLIFCMVSSAMPVSHRWCSSSISMRTRSVSSWSTSIYPPSPINRVLLQCDKWNRSYLMHLLAGKCEHAIEENASQINAELVPLCPHASTLLARFTMLHRLGNTLDQPVKTIFKSQYCLPLRMLLFNYLLENDSSFSVQFKDFFQYFPGKFLPTYSNYLQHIVRNQNLDGPLESFVLRPSGIEADDSETIRFLLQRGARFNTTAQHQLVILNRLRYTQSTIPFLLLDYSMYIDPSSELRSNVNRSRVLLYTALVGRCGYATELQKKFDEFKTVLPEQQVKTLVDLIDMKNPACLSRLCLQKLRSSVKHLGDDTLEQLDDHLPQTLKQSLFPLRSGEYSRFSHLLT